MVPEERGHAAFVLQLRDIGIEVHPVDALDFQRDVLPQDFGDTPW
jgi:hypothetical protein